MIKLLHFADFHLGVDTHGPKDPETGLGGRVLDFLDSLDALVDYAYQENVDIVLFAGDAYHKNNPDPTLQREFGKRIMRLSEQCPIVMLVGNHDMPGTVEKASAIDAFSVLRAPNVIIGDDYEVIEVETKSGNIQIGTFPYPRGKYYSEDDISDIIIGLHESIDLETPRVFLGHFSVCGAKLSSENQMIIGKEAEVSLDILANKYWNYIALGHLHMHQCLSDYPPVVYAGSLDRVDFSEEYDDKGFIYIEIDNDTTKWEFVLVDARPFKTIMVDCRDTDVPMRKIISKIGKLDIKDAIVRVRLNILEGMDASIHKDRIFKELEKSGAYYIHAIMMDVERESRIRLDPGENVSSLTHTDLLQKYFKENGKSKSEMKDLMELAKEIMDNSLWQ